MSDYNLIDVESNFRSGLLEKATDGEYSNNDFRSDMDKLWYSTIKLGTFSSKKYNRSKGVSRNGRSKKLW